MGKVFQATFNIPGGYSVGNPTPINADQFVENVDDLTNGTIEQANAYVGMTIGIPGVGWYELRASDVSIPGNWIKFLDASKTENDVLLGDGSVIKTIGVLEIQPSDAILLDWSNGQLSKVELNQATTFSFANKKGYWKQILLKGEFSFVLPDGGNILNSDDYDGTVWNLIQIYPISDTEYIYSITNVL